MTDIFIRTKIDLLEKSIAKVEKTAYELRKQLDALEYELQIREFEEIENFSYGDQLEKDLLAPTDTNKYADALAADFHESLEALRKVGA